jgi:hypothetical protein
VKRKLLLVSAALVIAAGLSAVAAYTVVDDLTQDGSVWRGLGLLGFPAGLALSYGAFSSHRSVHAPWGLGVTAVLAGAIVVSAGPDVEVPFLSVLLGFLLYALGWMVARLPSTARRLSREV